MYSVYNIQYPVFHIKNTFPGRSSKESSRSHRSPPRSTNPLPTNNSRAPPSSPLTTKIHMVGHIAINKLSSSSFLSDTSTSIGLPFQWVSHSYFWDLTDVTLTLGPLCLWHCLHTRIETDLSAIAYSNQSLLRFWQLPGWLVGLPPRLSSFWIISSQNSSIFLKFPKISSQIFHFLPAWLIQQSSITWHRQFVSSSTAKYYLCAGWLFLFQPASRPGRKWIIREEILGKLKNCERK